MIKAMSIILFIIALNAQAVEIKNFKSGLVCTDKKTFGWVCHNVEDIYVTGQSQCTFNNKSIPCTWYGFSFDYEKNRKGDVISCEYSSSDQAVVGNPKKIINDKSNVTSYTFELKEEKGHFYNPQYTGLSVSSVDKSLQTGYTVCKSKEGVLFDFSYRFHLPVLKD